MVTKEEGKAAFAVLRPFCVRVMNSSSVESLLEMQNCLKKINSPLHPHLVDYVLLPVRTVMKRYGRYNVAKSMLY